jgi:hypothetical protein
MTNGGHVTRFRGPAWSYPLLAFERRSSAVSPWACLGPCPAPKPRDRRAARARGTRGSLRRTLVARPALAVAISAPSLLIRRWRKPARTENAAQKQGRPTGQITRICARDFLSRGTEPVPRYRKHYGSDLWGQSEIRDGAEENRKPTLPSGGSPLAVLGVNLGHKNGSERELSLSSLPRQFTQIAAR